MTVKRFTFDEDVNEDCMYEMGVFSDNGELMETTDVLNCLNNLHEENEWLKAINKHLIRILEHTGATIEIEKINADEKQGLILKTLKKDFYEEYKEFDTITAWDCLVDEVNRVNTVCELHDFLVDNLGKFKELE